MSRFQKIVLIMGIILAITILMPELADAQCPMCRMSAEANLKDGGTAGKGLNRGILYMLAAPYALVASLGYIWWRNNGRYMQEDDQ